MLKFIDNFLNRITMYRLVLYFLFALLLVAEVLAYFQILQYSPLMLLLSTVIILFVCYVINVLFAKVYNAPTNAESLYITALILALIITPPTSFQDISYFLFICWVALWAMASKYIFAIGKKHIFNPAAFAVMLTALTINQSASWWVGTQWMAPFVLIGGILIARKLRRFDLVLTFIFSALIATIIMHTNNVNEIPKLIWNTLLTSPLLFFAFIMITEPLTTPPTKRLRMSYALLVGAIFDPMIHLKSIYSTPELSLIIGNIYSYLVSPKRKLLLKLKEKTQIAKDTYEFSFVTDQDELDFHPGQYLEWTLGHKWPDTRGNRRYFTIASSPLDEELRIGVKFYPESSSYKKALLNLEQGGTIVASQLAGDFTMPHNKNTKLCFIAGGIGVTPFESMINYMLEHKQKRDVVVFYSNKTPADIAYMDTFTKAKNELGINTIYAISDTSSVPTNWSGKVGIIDKNMIMTSMPDYKERMYFISGPYSMITSFKDMLLSIGIPRSQIKTDFFPGFA